MAERHRGQTRGMSGSLGYGSTRDYGPDPIVERPRMMPPGDEYAHLVDRPLPGL